MQKEKTQTMSGTTDVKILEGSILRESDKAILFLFNDSENWLPKSQIKISKNKDKSVVEMPMWLWDKMNEIE